MKKLEPVIEIRNMVAKYGTRTILEDINVDIFPEEITVILGGSGSGKTTLLKNMLRLYEPAAGTVKFWGEDVLTMDEHEFNDVLKKTGMLFQSGALLNSISLYENISIPLEMHTKLSPKIRDRMIRVKLSQVGLSEAIYMFPSELSGGMKKRAALARAMAMDPSILF